MAHEVEQMFSVKERPWHGLGHVITNAPTIEEGIQLAGLDWNVDLKDIYVENKLIDEYKAVMRSDNDACLGTVSKSYKPLQNEDAFRFFQPFLDTGLATLDTAGCLKGGKRVWVLAKMNSNDMVIDEKTEDRVEKFLLLSNTHDGSSAIKVGYTPIRVVCNNTLTAAENNVNSQLIRVTHRGDVLASIEQVRTTMDIINQGFATTEAQYRALAAKTNINTADLEKYIKYALDIDGTTETYKTTNASGEEEIKIEVCYSNTAKKKIETITEIFENEPAHNYWTAYNAINYYLNHIRGKNLESSYNAMWFESAKMRDRRSLKYALAQ